MLLHGNLWTLCMDKWATSSLGQIAPSVWKCPKTQIWDPDNLNPLQGHTHTLTPSSINTQNRSKNYVWIYHGMHWTLWYGTKLSVTLKSKDLAILWFWKRFQTHPLKPAEAKPSLRKVSLLSAKLHMLFPAHLWVTEFWPQIYSLWQVLNWGLLSKILASTKMGRA